MALSEPDKKWIKREIQSAINPTGWRKLLTFLQTWSIPSVAVGLSAIWVGIYIYEWGDRDEAIKFRVRTEDKLGTIEGQLRTLLAPIRPNQVLNEIKNLPSKQFANSLDALRQVSKQTIDKVKSDESTIRDVIHKLRSVEDTTPEYWPALLQFLTFTSAVLAPPDVPPHGAPGTIISHNKINRAEGQSFGSFEKQIVLLQGGDLVNEVFTKCRVIFTNDPVRMRNVKFTDCVFEMPVTNVPTPFLKDASRILLASDFKAVSISALS